MIARQRVSRRRGTTMTGPVCGRLTLMASQLWHDAPIVALDLEGSGAQDHEKEAILEVAAVPLTGGEPGLDQAFTSLINPGRAIPRRPWISPGLTDAVLATAPPLAEVAPKLAALINDRWVVGHNVSVDWRLLHRHLPGLRPAGLLDTLALARALGQAERSLSALTERMGLAQLVEASAPGSQPHRALWDTVAVAHLLGRLVARLWPDKPPTLATLRLTAGIPLGAAPTEQPGLFE
jgi:DNA polymerase-3 subunit epsilon